MRSDTGKSLGTVFFRIPKGEIRFMDFATFLSKAVEYIAVNDRAYIVLYALATCLLTQLVKKLLVNKAKVDVLHKFDWTPLIPFVFATGFAFSDVYLVQKMQGFDLSVVLHVVVSALTIGALSSTVYRFIKSCTGQSLSSLMKDDVFGVFYTQLLYFGNIREQIADKKLTLKEFIEQVKLLASDAEKIYKQDGSIDAKRCRLAKLLGGIIDEKSVETCVNVLNEALERLVNGG